MFHEKRTWPGHHSVTRGNSSFAILMALALAACGARTALPAPDGEACADAGAERQCQTICGIGVEQCVAGGWRGCTAPKPKPPALVGVVRDFHDTHPDFEGPIISDDPGIVGPVLGPDDKPVYAGPTPTTLGKAAFDQWFSDVPTINLKKALTLPLKPVGNGVYRFADGTFFPIDGELFGNEGRDHNFHFTFEVATRFRYQGGEVFRFTGDDDFWVFINRRLVIDLGGVHGAETASVSLDGRAQELGIKVGGVYPLHVFFAERHTSASHFTLETTISELDLCD